MSPNQKPFRKSYSISFFLLVLQVITACNHDNATLTTQSQSQKGIPIPGILTAALPSNGTLSAYIRVDGGARQTMLIAGGTAFISINGLTQCSHNITIEFEYELQGKPLMLASASKTIDVAPGENTLSFVDSEYDTNRYDNDQDGISNLAELNNGTDPFTNITVHASPDKPKTLSFSWTPLAAATHYKLLVNRDGKSGYTQVGADTATTSMDVEIPVHLTDWINATYLVEAHNGATTIFTYDAIGIVGPMVGSIGYFKASNAGMSDRFGSIALSADGNTLAVGAYGEASNGLGIDCAGNVGVDCQADNSLSASGAVYVFTRAPDKSWSQQAYVKASNTGANDLFGFSVALSADGNTLAVGASEDSNALGVNCNGDKTDTTGVIGILDCQEDNSALDSGAVYVFSRDGWGQQAYVKASNTGASDYFGHSVALSANGNTLAVGADGEDSNATGINGDPVDDCGTATPGNCATDSGAVYLY